MQENVPRKSVEVVLHAHKGRAGRIKEVRMKKCVQMLSECVDTTKAVRDVIAEAARRHESKETDLA